MRELPPQEVEQRKRDYHNKPHTSFLLPHLDTST
nr:MAG TPA: hypothetical protein [Caudoviricetes sp.]